MPIQNLIMYPLYPLTPSTTIKSTGNRRSKSFIFTFCLLTMRLHSFIRNRIGKLVKRETWVLTPESSTFAPSGYYSNKDMDPVPEDQRTWSTMNYVLYWVSDAANIPTWELASSMLAIGLSWYNTFISTTVALIIILDGL